MVNKKSSKKSSRSNEPESLEKAIERGIERGISNTVKKGFNKSCSSKEFSCSSTNSWIYFLGFIGAAIYYVSHASGFWSFVLAILQAIIWPAMVVLKILGL